MRLFIAVPLPTKVADRAAACLPPGLPGLKVVAPALLHITVAFLGWTANDRLTDVIDAARVAAAATSPFELTLDHAGRFPATGRPTTVWLGAGPGKAALERLVAVTRRELALRDSILEDRPFAAHLTLARVRGAANGPERRTISAAVDALTVPALIIAVDRIAVMESRLSGSGPRYTARAELELR